MAKLELLPMYEAYKNTMVTRLSTDIDAIQTTITVDDSSKFLGIPLPNLFVIGGTSENAETVKVTNINGNILTVERGIQEVAKPWSTGQHISRNLTALEHDNMVKNIIALGEQVNKRSGNLQQHFNPSAVNYLDNIPNIKTANRLVTSTNMNSENYGAFPIGDRCFVVSTLNSANSIIDITNRNINPMASTTSAPSMPRGGHVIGNEIYVGGNSAQIHKYNTESNSWSTVTTNGGIASSFIVSYDDNILYLIPQTGTAGKKYSIETGTSEAVATAPKTLTANSYWVLKIDYYLYFIQTTTNASLSCYRFNAKDEVWEDLEVTCPSHPTTGDNVSRYSNTSPLFFDNKLFWLTKANPSALFWFDFETNTYDSITNALPGNVAQGTSIIPISDNLLATTTIIATGVQEFKIIDFKNKKVSDDTFAWSTGNYVNGSMLPQNSRYITEFDMLVSIGTDGTNYHHLAGFFDEKVFSHWGIDVIDAKAGDIFYPTVNYSLDGLNNFELHKENLITEDCTIKLNIPSNYDGTTNSFAWLKHLGE